MSYTEKQFCYFCDSVGFPRLDWGQKQWFCQKCKKTVNIARANKKLKEQGKTLEDV